jgi:hypothetical protein
MKTWRKSIGLPCAVLTVAIGAGAVSVRADAYSSAVLADNPVVYFRLNETNGDYFSSDNVYTGKVIGGFSRTYTGPGPLTLRSSYLFNGLDLDNVCPFLANGTSPADAAGSQYITVTNAAAVNPGTNDLTLEAWLFLPQNYVTNTGVALAKMGNASNSYRVGYYLTTTMNGGVMSVQSHLLDSDSSWASAALSTPLAVVGTGVFCHVAAVFDRHPPGTEDTATIYVNGIAQGTTSNSMLKTGNVISGSTQDIQPLSQLGIGAIIKSTGGRGFAINGRVDDVAIYTRALSAAAISNHYAVAAGTRRGTSLPPVTNSLLVALHGGSAIASPTDQVGLWADEASHGGVQDFLQSTSVRRPTWSYDLLPSGRKAGVVNFDRTVTNYLALAATPVMDTNTWTSFVAFKPNAAAGGSSWTLFNSSYTSGAGSASPILWFVILYPTNLYSVTRAAANTWVGPSFILSDRDRWFVLSTVWNGTTALLNGNGATTTVARLQDQFRTLYPPSSAVGGNSTPLGHINTWIGGYNVADPAWTLPFDGKIAEILFYNTALPAADVNTIESYLVDKYLVRRGMVLWLR